MMISEEIKRLHELRLAGALTDAEFAQAKARLLDAGKPDWPPGGPSAGLVQEFNRLRRSRADRWLGGVCGGLARMTGMASWVWRLVFALFTLGFGFGLVLYILLWIFIPDEEIGN